MKPKLVHKPNNYTYHKLLVNFAGGVPLTPDQLNFIYRHEKTLSTHGLDPVLKYYLKSFHRKTSEQHSFLMHKENFDAESAKELKKRLNLLLKDKKRGERIHLSISPQQYLQFKNAAHPSLILYHGNHFITGAPFHPGGIPHTIFFQWGNLFGVAKYVVLPEERALKSNVLIYFEDRHERNLNQYVEDIKKEMQHELKASPQHAHTHALEKQTPQQNYRHSPFQTPKLTLSLNTDKNNEDK